MRRLLVPALATVLGLGLTSAPPASAGVAVEEKPFPSRIDLPDGFQPEGIAVGPGATAWLGSLADGDIYRVSLRTGEGAVAFEGPGTPPWGSSATAAAASTSPGHVRHRSRRSTPAPASRRRTPLGGGVRQRRRADQRRPPGSPTPGLPRLYRLDRGEGGAPAADRHTRAAHRRVGAGHRVRRQRHRDRTRRQGFARRQLGRRRALPRRPGDRRSHRGRSRRASLDQR